MVKHSFCRYVCRYWEASVLHCATSRLNWIPVANRIPSCCEKFQIDSISNISLVMMIWLTFIFRAMAPMKCNNWPLGDATPPNSVNHRRRWWLIWGHVSSQSKWRGGWGWYWHRIVIVMCKLPHTVLENASERAEWGGRNRNSEQTIAIWLFANRESWSMWHWHWHFTGFLPMTGIQNY